jgi:peptidoglycan/xylan/chitin deacetylase (PgdA/CDA1 family)
MTWKSHILTGCSKFIANSYQPPAGILLPSGHIVGDVVPPHVQNLLRVPTLAMFRSHIDFLAKHYCALSPGDLERTVNSCEDKIPPRYFVLSFDDGMREIYEVIAPFLREQGIPAIFFINSNTIDNKQLMWRHKVSLLIARAQQNNRHVPTALAGYPGKTLCAKLLSVRFADRHILDEIASLLDVDFDEYLRTNRPYMTTSQVVELARQGFEFGSHSASHPYFNELSVESQQEEISKSVGFIRALGIPCRYFAFPFHDNGVPISLFNYMKSLGLLFSFGTSDARVDSVPFSLQRFALDAHNSDSSIPKLLRELSAKSFALRMSRNEIIRRNSN